MKKLNTNITTNELAYKIWVAIASDTEEPLNQIKASAQKIIQDILDNQRFEEAFEAMNNSQKVRLKLLERLNKLYKND